MAIAADRIRPMLAAPLCGLKESEKNVPMVVSALSVTAFALRFEGVPVE